MPSDGSLTANRLKDVAAMLLVGDAVLAFVVPEKRVRLWHSGPGWWERLVTPLRERPDLVRLLSVAEAGVGLWLAGRVRVHPSAVPPVRTATRRES
ncbi:hypothetical protein [Frigoriglobus tundricola]|uniref:Uncharacterized protein n=1 Tax=Frigoriglobus tundricola TaxID=2774151 RepID=A0A6M5YJL2_9BACT|nr:hypothetical protein [Frigoriglobus tundricola]QJW93162.1 hypothetical protein FTUN_0667 [Frigoriglobus tundricola]